MLSLYLGQDPKSFRILTMPNFVQLPTAVKLYLTVIMICQAFAPSLTLATHRGNCQSNGCGQQRCGSSISIPGALSTACQCCCRKPSDSTASCCSKKSSDSLVDKTNESKVIGRTDAGGKNSYQGALTVEPAVRCTCLSAPSLPSATQVPDWLKSKRKFDFARLSAEPLSPGRQSISCSVILCRESHCAHLFSQKQLSVWRL